MPAVARQGDTVSTGHGCDGTTTLDAPSQSTVKIEGQLVCRLGDLTVSHAVPSGDDCVPHTAPITGSSGTVKIAGALVARVGDACDAGSITSGAGTVSIGD
jgi:uncharacterized Zn-binding protein involved in type VI secretion